MNYSHGAKKDSEGFQSYMTQNDTKQAEKLKSREMKEE